MLAPIYRGSFFLVILYSFVLLGCGVVLIIFCRLPDGVSHPALLPLVKDVEWHTILVLGALLILAGLTLLVSDIVRFWALFPDACCPKASRTTAAEIEVMLLESLERSLESEYRMQGESSETTVRRPKWGHPPAPMVLKAIPDQNSEPIIIGDETPFSPSISSSESTVSSLSTPGGTGAVFAAGVPSIERLSTDTNQSQDENAVFSNVTMNTVSDTGLGGQLGQLGQGPQHQLDCDTLFIVNTQPCPCVSHEPELFAGHDHQDESAASKSKVAQNLLKRCGSPTSACETIDKQCLINWVDINDSW